MARKLKTYITSIGFFEEAIAAPSMKAALEAWGSDHNLFHKGFAKETTDPAIVAETMKHPGVILKRPVGSNGVFKKHSKLPDAKLIDKEPIATPKRNKERAAKKKPLKVDRKLKERERKAAEAYEREEKRRQIQQRKEEALRKKLAEKRKAVTATAERALKTAEAAYNRKLQELKKQQEVLNKKIEGEEARWDSENDWKRP
jgi:colicin import membrane protein